MKDLLKHLESELHSSLSQLSGASSPTNKKLEYIYEDLLSKTEMALDELDADRQNDYTADDSVSDFVESNHELDRIIEQINNLRQDSERDREAKYGPRRNVSAAPNNSGPKVDLDSPFSKSGSGEFDPVADVVEGGWGGSSDPFNPSQGHPNDRHHAWQDGPKESFEDLKKNVENVTAADFDPNRLRKLADIAEEAENGDIDPRDMSDDQFQKMLSRLQPDLVDWATGGREIESENVKKQKKELLRDIQGAITNASNIAENTKGNNAAGEAFKHLQKEIGNIIEEKHNTIEPDER